MKVKITHSIPNKPDWKVGHIYDLTAKEAQPLLEQDWASPAKEKKEDKKDEPAKTKRF